LADVFLSSWLVWAVFLFTLFWLKGRWFRIHWVFWLGLWLSFFQAARLGGYSFVFLSLLWLADYLSKSLGKRDNGGF
jgi:hypothetical protein